LARIYSAKILKNTVIDAGNKRFNAFTLYYDCTRTTFINHYGCES